MRKETYSMGDEILNKLLKHDEKVEKAVKQGQNEAKINELIEIRKELAQIREQQDVTPILERLEKIENQQTILISLLNSKLDLDKEEKELMDLIKVKVKASK